MLRIWWQYKKTDKEKSFLFLCQLCIKKTKRLMKVIQR